MISAERWRASEWWTEAGVIGQFLGAIATFTVALVALRDVQPRVRVRTAVARVVTATHAGNRESEERLFIWTVNVGTRPVKITKSGLRKPWRQRRSRRIEIIMPEAGRMPVTLTEGEETFVWTPVKELYTEGWRDRDFPYAAWAADSAGRLYQAKSGKIGKAWWNLTGRVVPVNHK